MSLLATMAKTYGKDRASREKLERIQRKRLRALVAYARKNSPFYGELYRGLGADWTLGDLPPVTKPELMARFDDVVTDRTVTMARVRDFTRDIDNVGRMLDGKYLVQHPFDPVAAECSRDVPMLIGSFGPSPGRRISRGSWPTARKRRGSSPITGSTWPAACPGICSCKCLENRPRSPWT